MEPRLNVEAEVWSLPTSIGARSWFSGAERDFLTESESPWVADAASSGSRKEELVERKASVSLKTAVTEIRVHEQHEEHERGVEFANWQRRKVAVFGSGALFPYGERVSLGHRCGLQWTP